MISIEEENGEITAIIVNGERLDSDDGEVWFLPKRLLEKEQVDDLPMGISFELCDRLESSMVVLDSLPVRIERLAHNTLKAEFEDSGTRKYWDGAIGFKVYMEAKKAVVEERATEIGDIEFSSYDDDGAYIHLFYSTTLESDTFGLVLQLIDQVILEIEGAAEIRLGSQLWTPPSISSEKEYTLRIILPILRKIGFQNVRYNHGKREFGRDVLFARMTEFHEIEHWGAQIKHGDVSGGANSEIDSMIGQIDDAFRMPFYDLYSKQRHRISKMAIIISGKFTENAIEKICEKIENHAVRNNIVFLDGDKIQTLVEQFSWHG